MIFREEIDSFQALRVRDVIRQGLLIATYITVALVSWRCLILFTQAPGTLVVVISGSMEPGYHRGDLLFLHRRFEDNPIQAGDVVVYNLPGRTIPIVHRVVRIHERTRDGKRLFLTKGDNNARDDRFLYPLGVDWVEEDQIIGKSFAYVPRIGYLTIAMTEIPFTRYLSLGLILFFMLVVDED